MTETVCGTGWADTPCRYAVRPAEHVCTRRPLHNGPHQCSCGSLWTADDGRGIVPPSITAALEAGLCTCDSFADPHPPGQVDGTVYCEQLYTSPTVSPHLFDVPPAP